MRTPAQLIGAAGRRLRRLAKAGVGVVDGSGSELPDVAMIFGCQRSGTTMMQDIFDRDLRCRVYRDVSAISDEGGPESIELNPLDRVEAEFRRTRAAFVVAKPLADSHRVAEILDRFPRARALWMYRDFRDVAGSDLRYFGTRNGISNLAPMAAGDPDNWRSAGLSADVATLIRRWYDPDMNPNDAAALFWYARNALFFEQGLQDDGRVRLLHYATFVADPVAEMGAIYAWLGRPWPGPGQVSIVHTGSVGKARSLALSAEVEALCEEMAERLESVRTGAGRSTPGPPPAGPGT